MKKRILSMVLCSALLITTVTGCGKSAEKATTTSDKKVELEFFQQKSEVVDVYNKIIEKFMSENPNIKIKQTATPDAAKVLVTRLSTNDIPDIFSIFPTQTIYKKMMDEGIMLPLTKEAFMNNVSEDTVNLIKYKGEAYALPLTVNAFGLYYNKDIFAKYQLQVPKTLDDLYAICETLKKNGVQPFVFMDKDTGAFGQQGERLLGGSINHEAWKVSEKVAKGETSFTTEPDMKLLAQTILKIREYGPKDTLGIGSDQASNDFANGKAAMILSGTWGLGSYKKLNPSMNVGVTNFPSISSQESYTCGTVDSALAISATSKNADAAKKFLQFLTKPEIAQMFCDVDKNPNLVKGVKYNVEELKPINDMINKGKFSLIPTSYWPAGFRDEWQVQLQQLVMTKDVEGFLKTSDKLTKQYYNSKK